MLHGIEDRIEMIIQILEYIDKTHPYRSKVVDELSVETYLVPRTIHERYIAPYQNSGYIGLDPDERMILTVKGKTKLNLMKNRNSPQEKEKERNE